LGVSEYVPAVQGVQLLSETPSLQLSEATNLPAGQKLQGEHCRSASQLHGADAYVPGLEHFVEHFCVELLSWVEVQDLLK
jgi:hypothetical protein